VLQTSYPDSITWEQRHVPGIVWTTHAGAETGHAIADVLYGSVNPAGRLTQTWPASESQLPADLNDYDIISSGQTYLYNRARPLYAFGHGLSYTHFGYANLRVRDGSVTVDVTNTGSRAGDEVVQLYTHQRTSRDVTAVKQLRAFQRVTLRAHQTATVRLKLSPADLAHWDVTRSRWVVESSVYDVMVGAASDDIRLRSTLNVRGETIPARDLTVPTRAENFDAYDGATLVDEAKTAGTAVAGPGWIAFRDARPVSGSFTARVSGAGPVEVRLDSPTGRVIGTAQATGTGGVYAYATTTAPLAKVTGRHDVYLVLGSGVRVATFRMG
jgi:beta-glucosidase